MKIKIYARDLQNMLKTAKGLELRKLDIDAQKSLLIKNDKLIMNNLNTQLESRFNVDIYENGTTLIPESTLKILEDFKDNDLIITDELVKYDTKEIQYVNIYDDNFYTIDDNINEFLFEIPELELNHLLEVNYATSKDEARPILEGIQITENRFTALNGYYASIRYGEFNIDEEIILSPNVWKTLLKVVDKKSDKPVKVFWNKNDLVRFEFEDYNIIGKLLEGQFLNISELITNEVNTSIELNTKDLIKSVRTMKKLKVEEQLIDLIVNKTLKITTKSDMNIITDKFEILEFKGEPVEICFNINYFYDVINRHKNTDATLEFGGPLRPMYMKTDRCLELLMPVRRSKSEL